MMSWIGNTRAIHANKLKISGRQVFGLTLIIHSSSGFLGNVRSIAPCFVHVGVLLLKDNFLIDLEVRDFFPEKFVVEF